MSENRPHGRVHTAPDARAELRRLAGRQFDPALVEAFCALEPSAPTRYEAAATGR